MPAGKGALRIAIEDFLETNPLTERFVAFWAGFRGRVEQGLPLLFEVMKHPFRLRLIGPFRAVASYAGWVFLNNKGALDDLRELTQPFDYGAFIEQYAAFWKRILAPSPETGGMEVLGAALLEPMIAAVQAVSQQEGENPDDWLRRVYGTATAMIVGPGLVTGAIELAGVGQLESATALLQTLTQQLGLGVLGGGGAGVLAESGFLPQLRRAFRARYRPTRWTSAQIRDLFALGALSEPDLRTQLAQDGYRDQDIELWKALAYRNLTEGDVFALRDGGHINDVQAIARLRGLGFSEADIPLLFALNPPALLNEAAALTKSTARKAFRESLISEVEFIEALANLGISRREADLEIALARRQQEEDIKSLTISQVKAAWEENVLTDGEATHWLGVEGLGPQETGILLRTWRAGLEPKFMKLNKGTVVGAYVEGIFGREAAYGKLTEIGLTGDDARLELDLAEARNPEAFGAPAPRPTRQLAISVLEELLAAREIDEATFLAQVLQQGYAQADAELLLTAAMLRADAEPRPLGQGSIVAAYVAQVIDRARAEDELASLGFEPEGVSVILDTAEQQHPEVFAPETLQSIRLPSASALVEAVRNGILETDVYYARMVELGYARPDADMYLALATRSEKKRTKLLTPADIANAYEKHFIPFGEALRRLSEQGYSDGDAQMYLRLRVNVIAETEPWKLFLAGRLTIEDAVNQLFALGFTVEEIDEAVTKAAEGG